MNRAAPPRVAVSATRQDPRSHPDREPDKNEAENMLYAREPRAGRGSTRAPSTPKAINGSPMPRPSANNASEPRATDHRSARQTPALPPAVASHRDRRSTPNRSRATLRHRSNLYCPTPSRTNVLSTLRQLQFVKPEHRQRERHEHKTDDAQRDRRLQCDLKVLSRPGSGDPERRIGQRHRDHVCARQTNPRRAERFSPDRASMPDKIGIIGNTHGVNDSSSPKPRKAASTARMWPLRRRVVLGVSPCDWDRRPTTEPDTPVSQWLAGRQSGHRAAEQQLRRLSTVIVTRSTLFRTGG